MPRRRPVAYNGHPFAPGSEARTIPDRRSTRGTRVIPLCATCGKPANAPAHRHDARREAPPGRPERRRAVRVTRDRLRVTEAPAGMIPSAALPPALPAPAFVRRDHLALALALDAILDAADGGGLHGAAITFAVALRASLEVPRFRSAPEEPAQAEPEPEEVPPASPRWSNGHAPAVPALAPVEGGRRRDRDPAVARARSAAKGIRSERLRDLAVEAIRQGWAPRKSGGGHLRLERPGYAPVTVSTTANDDAMGHHYQNAKAQARRAGVDVSTLR